MGAEDGSFFGPYEPSIADTLRAALLDTDGLDSIPEPDPLITGLLYANSVVWAIGKAGHGKSLAVQDMVGCIGTGHPWQDHGVTQGFVLYVVAEGATGIRKRVRAWEQSYGRKMTDVRWLPVAVQAGKPAEWNALIEVAQELEPIAIIIDTQARVTVGQDENSAEDMGKFVHELERLRIATRACIIVVHHQGRNGEHARGSSAIDGAADTILQISKEDDLICIKNTKQKNAEEHEEITLRLSPIGKSVVLVIADGSSRGSLAVAMKTATKWWSLFRDDEVPQSQLQKALELSERTFYRHVRELLDAGRAVRREAGRSRYYYLTTDPDD